MIASRRRFLTGAVALLAAPAIVRVASIMPVKSTPMPSMSGEILAPGLRVGEIIAIDLGNTFDVECRLFRITAISDGIATIRLAS